MRAPLLAAALALALAPSIARAAGRRVRPLFEPTDLELEAPGTLEADVQLGYIRGPEAGRVVVPDVELDLGLTPDLELDLDCAYAVEGPPNGAFSFDHAAPDSLWLSAKLGLELFELGLGLQLGPKFPTAAGSHGLGGEALMVIGKQDGRWHLALNGGGFVDPDTGAGRPRGLEGGLDLGVDFGALSLTAELGGVKFFSGDPAQLVGTTGVTWSASDRVDLSLVALGGFFHGGDHYGLLFGVSPKVTFWR
jgi:hypothetical protein